MFRYILTAALTVLAASTAKAELLLEPYLGYETGSTSFNAPAFGDFKYSVSGTAIGARVGYSMPIFFIAADYSMGMLSSKVDSQPTGAGADAPSVSRQTLAAVVGAKIPLLQFYAGYAFLNDQTFKFASDETTFKGSGLKLGAGFTGLPFIAINLEYMMSTYNKYKNSAGESDLSASNTYKEASGSSLMLSVSAPFRL